jgi:hypothetical protein
MILFKVYKTATDLVIETSEGTRLCKLRHSNFKDMQALEDQCTALISQEVKTTAFGDGKWDSSYFYKIEAVSKPQEPNEQSFESRLPLGRRFDGHTSQKVYGPPGTGKTTLMLDHIKKQLEADVSPEDIAFISFSNAGANAAKKRVSESFPGYGSIDFPNFSTMHSLATKVGGGSGKTLCQEEHWKAFDKTIICFNEWTEVNDPSSIVVRYGHPVLDLASLAISRCTSFATQHDHIVGHDDRTQANIKESLSQYFGRNLLPNEVVDYAERYLLAYKTFKEDRNLVDFNDVIERIISDEFDDSLMPTFEVLIIDEAQDLSDFLWIFARKLIERAKVVYVAGDDDQAIMINFGASPHAFLLLPTTEKDYPLPKSYRVPEEVMSYVRSGTLKYVEELPNRVDKDWGTADHQGDVSPLSERPIQDHNGSSINGLFEDFTVIDLILKISTSREADWLVMAPTRATGERFSTALLEQQPPIPHFYRNKPYPNLSDLNNCKIRIQTVHASKGDQAENVAIIAESFGDVIMLVKDPRLAYVALTRAKKSMYPRVLKEGLLPSMSGAGQKWRAVAARFNDMFPGQRDL